MRQGAGDLVVFAGKGKGEPGGWRKGVASAPIALAILAVTLGRTAAGSCNRGRPRPKPALPTTQGGRPTHWNGSAIAINDNSIRILTMFVSAVFTVAPFHAAARMAMIDGAPPTAYVSRRPGRSLRTR